MTEEHDIDNDGRKGIIVYMQDDNIRSVGIYDMVGDELQYSDVNEMVGCDASEYTGNIGSAKRDDSNAIQAVFIEPDGSRRLEIYRVYNNEIACIYPMEDALQ